MAPELTTCPGYRFPAEVIQHAVRLYDTFGPSLRDGELLLADRGIIVADSSIRRGCSRFGQAFAAELRRRRPRPGDTWHLDEVFLRTGSVMHYRWRVVDQRGGVLDILVRAKRGPFQHESPHRGPSMPTSTSANG